MTTSTDIQHDELRQQALAQLEKRAEFRSHLVAYALVNALLIAIWFIVSDGGLFWPIFPILGWGIGVVLHGMETYQRPFTDERIAREMQRLAPHVERHDRPGD